MRSEYKADVLETEDQAVEPSLRPHRLADFIGQSRVKETLAIALGAAKARGESLDHVLFYGPPGLGKTTLSMLIANELGVELKTTSGPVIEKPGDLVALLTQLEEGDVLFIDEIHRLKPQVEEFIYSAMEDYRIDIRLEDGPNAQTITLPIARFTLVGATTRLGQLTPPLRARFGLSLRLEYYAPEELAYIVKRSAAILGVSISNDGALEIARRSRGTPRITNRFLRRVRDYADVKGLELIDEAVVDAALSMLNVAKDGMDEMDERILRKIILDFGGGPVGLNTLAVAIGEDAGTIEDVHESFLIQQGYLKRTPRGRMATAKAYERLGYQIPERLLGDARQMQLI